MNELLNKYWEGNTSIEEEQKIRSYFQGDTVAPEHLKYKGLFHTFDLEKSMEADGYDAFAKVKSQQQRNQKSNMKLWTGIAVAAGAALMVTIGSGLYDEHPEDLGTFESPEEAYEATLGALQLVSNKFNKGARNLEPLTEINQQTAEVFNLNHNF